MKHALAAVLALLFPLGSSLDVTAQSHAQHPEPDAIDDHSASRVRKPPDNLTGEEARTVALYQKVIPTVVTVLTRQAVSTPGGLEVRESLGSGVVIPPDGRILTAAHVIADADEITVRTRDWEARPARVLYSEPSADIALLELTEPDPSLPRAVLGDSDRLAVGQRLYVTGAPFGLEGTFTIGHISGFRTFDRLYDGTILAEFIQTDAAINSGNSGGPAFNSRGEVVGIASRILTASGGSDGLGFVVAINTALQLLALEDRPWLGIEGILLNREELAQLMNLDLEGGLLIQRVTRGSPADHVGLKAGSIPAIIFDREILLGGDLILKIGSQEACHSTCLIREGRHLAGLDEIPVTFLRGGRVQHVMVNVAGARRSLLGQDPPQ